jgi:hypothetical protein
MPSSREPGLVLYSIVSKEESQHATGESTDGEFTVVVMTPGMQGKVPFGWSWDGLSPIAVLMAAFSTIVLTFVIRISGRAFTLICLTFFALSFSYTIRPE